MAHVTDIDGRMSQGWGGQAPDGVHVNLAVARRGSNTAAAITTAFTSPSDGYTPVLACLGETQPDYVTVNPPTVILTKIRAVEGINETLVFGAAPVGISQAVLDAVAAGMVEPDQDTILLFSLWIDGRAQDETAVKHAARQAARAALREVFDPAADDARRTLVDRREHLRHPFYNGD